jgi:C1A family cysteine protease
MKFLLFLTFLSSVLSFPSLRGFSTFSISTQDVDLDLDEIIEWKEFTNFQERFNKRYSSLFELEERFDIFRSNYRLIQQHNSDITQNFTLGVNQFADLTNDEFRTRYTSGIVGERVGAYLCTAYSSTASGAPTAIDWRSKGGVTPVKDQGNCGSCWSFSSTGAMEGAWFVRYGQLLSFSEQELVDCANGISYGSHGCNGGQMDGAFKYGIQTGMCTEANYPYTSGNTGTSGACKSCNIVAKFSTCYDVKPNDQVSLKGAVAQQPVSVAIEADTAYFQLYKSGVLTSSACGTTLDHGVLVVGYGTENGNPYWLVKNSWSSSWGDQGYVKILRSESTNDAGICGIAKQPSFIKA